MKSNAKQEVKEEGSLATVVVKGGFTARVWLQ